MYQVPKLSPNVSSPYHCIRTETSSYIRGIKDITDWSDSGIICFSSGEGGVLSAVG